MRAAANRQAAVIASLISDPSRSAILTAMLDGRYHAAGELARMAGIQPQTASFHLAKLTEAGLIAVEKQGRHRYYGIANRKSPGSWSLCCRSHRRIPSGRCGRRWRTRRCGMPEPVMIIWRGVSGSA